MAHIPPSGQPTYNYSSLARIYPPPEETSKSSRHTRCQHTTIPRQITQAVQISKHLHGPLLLASSSISRDTAARRFLTLSTSSTSRRCSILARDCVHFPGVSAICPISSLIKPHTWIKLSERLAFRVHHKNSLKKHYNVLDYTSCRGAYYETTGGAPSTDSGTVEPQNLIMSWRLLPVTCKAAHRSCSSGTVSHQVEPVPCTLHTRMAKVAPWTLHTKRF